MSASTRENFHKLDLTLAAQIQRSMLPKVPVIPGWQVDYHFQPVAEVSGDLVDLYNFGDQFFDEEQTQPNTGILLADATGHGVSAGLVTMIARQLFFRAHRDYKSQGIAAALYNANVELLRDLKDTGLYLSCVYIELLSNGIRYGNGSHPKILLISRSKQKTFALPNDGFLFGIESFVGKLTERFVPIQQGDILLAYTDGLTDTRSAGSGEHLGPNGVVRAIKKCSACWSTGDFPPDAAKLLVKAIQTEVLETCGPNPVTPDDVTFIVMVKMK